VEVIKRLFIAATGEQRSIRSAVATVLFDNAADALAPEDGLTRKELGDWVNHLLGTWQMDGADDDRVVAGDDVINTALQRIGNQLPEFVETQLPFRGVTKIEGPTRNQRQDRVERLWLAITYTPPAEDALGLVGRTIEEGLRSSEGGDRLADYQRALAAGAPHTVYEASETHGHSPNRKRLLILSVCFLLTAGGLLAHPTTRKWIMRGLGKADAWIMPPPAPPPARPHGSKTATPAHTPPKR
jgi:hypothetical protein